MALDQMVHRVRRAVLLHGGMSDGELLDRFIADRDEVAFAGLVARHGAMVFAVCRRVVGHVQDAEDAFQATFLVLVRKAESVLPRDAVGNWLYGVAYRTSLAAKAQSAKRRAREAQVHDMPHPAAPEQLWHDLAPVLDRELSRLPDKYRLPVVLCDLEGRGRQEVSQQLRLAEGTLSSRLARGRKLLAGRLARHGFALSAGALALALAPAAAAGTTPPALIASTVQAAIAGVIAAPVAGLVEGVLQAMFMSKIKSAALLLLLAAFLGSGIGVVAHDVLARPEPTPGPVPVQVAVLTRDIAEETAGGRDEAPRTRPEFMGKIAAIAKDARSITVEVAPAERGDAVKTIEVKLTASTKLRFSSVGLGGAKLTEGYLAQVWTVDGAKDTADHIHVFGMESERREPDLFGGVNYTANNPKNTMILDMGPRGRDNEGRSVLIRFTDKTQLVFSNVGPGSAIQGIDYRAQVWLQEGTKDIASRVRITGTAEKFSRDMPEQKADSMGKVAAVSKDGTSLTLQLPPRERGEQPVQQEIKLSDKTRTIYFDIGPGGNQPKEGYMARVWLAEGSKDTAGKIFFHGVPKEPRMLRGKVVGIAKDGKSITLETPGKERGDAPMHMNVKFTPQTKLVFRAVGRDGAMLTEGYIAQIMLAEDSTDTATHVVLGPAPAMGERR
jgi:RNA polymerase sigma factor (sigma-70 family)